MKDRDDWLYVVVTREGKLKAKGGKVTAYRSQKAAERWARNPGDSVVVLDLDLTREPVFIRGVVL